jgi:hypothetical protein
VEAWFLERLVAVFDRERLRGVAARPDDPEVLVVCLHGNAGAW